MQKGVVILYLTGSDENRLFARYVEYNNARYNCNNIRFCDSDDDDEDSDGLRLLERCLENRTDHFRNSSHSSGACISHSRSCNYRVADTSRINYLYSPLWPKKKFQIILNVIE